MKGSKRQKPSNLFNPAEIRDEPSIFQYIRSLAASTKYSPSTVHHFFSDLKMHHKDKGISDVFTKYWSGLTSNLRYPLLQFWHPLELLEFRNSVFYKDILENTESYIENLIGCIVQRKWDYISEQERSIVINNIIQLCTLKEPKFAKLRAATITALKGNYFPKLLNHNELLNLLIGLIKPDENHVVIQAAFGALKDCLHDLYNYLGNYKEELYESSWTFFEVCCEDPKKEKFQNLVEFWSYLCEVESERLETGEQVSNYILEVHSSLIRYLTVLIYKMEPIQEEKEDRYDTPELPSSCLTFICHLLTPNQIDIRDLMLPGLRRHLTSTSSLRERACLILGSIQESLYLEDDNNVMLPVLLKLAIDTDERTRDTALFTIQRILQVRPQSVYDTEQVSNLVNLLTNAMTGEPPTATKAFYTIVNLVGIVPDDKITPIVSTLLDIVHQEFEIKRGTFDIKAYIDGAFEAIRAWIPHIVHHREAFPQVLNRLCSLLDRITLKPIPSTTKVLSLKEICIRFLLKTNTDTTSALLPVDLINDIEDFNLSDAEKREFLQYEVVTCVTTISNSSRTLASDYFKMIMDRCLKQAEAGSRCYTLTMAFRSLSRHGDCGVYAPRLMNYLCASISEKKADMDLTMSVIGEVIRNIGPRVAPFTDKLMQELVVLRGKEPGREYVAPCIGDLTLANYTIVEPHINEILPFMCEYLGTILTEGPPLKLSNVLEGFFGVFQGFGENFQQLTTFLPVFFEQLEKIVTSQLLYNLPNIRKLTVGILGVLALHWKGVAAPYLRKPFVNNAISESLTSSDHLEVSQAIWARDMIHTII